LYADFCAPHTRARAKQKEDPLGVEPLLRLRRRDVFCVGKQSFYASIELRKRAGANTQRDENSRALATYKANAAAAHEGFGSAAMPTNLITE